MEFGFTPESNQQVTVQPNGFVSVGRRSAQFGESTRHSVVDDPTQMNLVDFSLCNFVSWVYLCSPDAAHLLIAAHASCVCGRGDTALTPGRSNSDKAISEDQEESAAELKEITHRKRIRPAVPNYRTGSSFPEIPVLAAIPSSHALQSLLGPESRLTFDSSSVPVRSTLDKTIHPM